ncbi:MAG TPA: magnesium/cobalt transporter CorA [Usitatibacter sp.]|jgi:magnesium transporter|nr:magnesium/cobalt transporter CorA [Usitatibacter sp.]
MLVNCVAYQQGRKIADISREEISDYLRQPDTFVWVALKDPTPAEMEEMRQEFGLHRLAIEDALHGHQRPKIEEYGDILFSVVQIPELRDGTVEMAELDMFVGPNFVLTVRERTEHGFVAVRQRAEAEPNLLKHGAGFVFYALLDNVVDRYFPVVDALETELEKLERSIFEPDARPRANIQALYDLKHKLMDVRHAVEPLIEVLHKLYGGRVPLVCVGMQDYFRDVQDHLLRISTQVDGLRDMVTTALSVNLSMITLSEGEVTKRLAAYGALVAVPTMIAGIYGMNFKNMPELDLPWGYPIVLLLMFGLDAWLWAKFRKTGWL